MKTRKNSRNVLLINFSAHPAFLMRSSLISADWPGALQEVWNTNSETDDNIVFLQGFCGDLLPASFQINKIDRFSIGGVLDFFTKPLKFRTSNSINSARKFAAKFVKHLKTDESPWQSVESNGILIRNEAVFLEYELKKYSQSCRFRISENSQKRRICLAIQCFFSSKHRDSRRVFFLGKTFPPLKRAMPPAF